MSDAIRAVDLSKRYRKVAALDGLSLAVPEGSVFGLFDAMALARWHPSKYS